jgi:hypothetical protein
MEQKTLDQDRLEKVLLALGTLCGLDRAIRLLEAQRNVVTAALHGSRSALQAMTLGDLADGLSLLPTIATMERRGYRTHRSPDHAPTMHAKKAHRPITKAKTKTVKAKAKKTEPTKAATPTFNGAMTTALKTMFANGPKKIAQIAASLKDQGVIKDTSPETKKAVVKFITHDSTFSCKTRGVFGLRQRTA